MNLFDFSDDILHWFHKIQNDEVRKFSNVYKKKLEKKKRNEIIDTEWDPKLDRCI